MTESLADKIKAKMGDKPKTEVSKEIGVSGPSLTAVLDGKKANKATAAKYATYLGIPTEEVLELVKSINNVKKSGKKRGRKAAIIPKVSPTGVQIVLSYFGVDKKFTSQKELVSFLGKGDEAVSLSLGGLNKTFKDLGEVKKWIESQFG